MDASVPAPRVTHRLERPLLWAYQTVAFYGVLAVFGIVFLGWNLPATTAYWLLPHRRSLRFGQAVIMHGFRTLLGLMRVAGLAHFDLTAIDALRDEPGLLIAPNHPTLLDALLVTSRLPRIVCITKASLWDNPALGAGARLAGYIRNDAPHRLVRRAAAAMRDGSQLLIFPEGTRTVTPPVGPFRAGFALMARQAGGAGADRVSAGQLALCQQGMASAAPPRLPARLPRPAWPPVRGQRTSGSLFQRTRGLFQGGTRHLVKHAVLVPSFNTGPVLLQTVRDVLAVWTPVWVVLDGSTDGSAAALSAMACDGLHVLALPQNGGKGGGRAARAARGGGERRYSRGHFRRGWPASGGLDPGFRRRLAQRAWRDDSRPAAIRAGGACLAQRRPPHLQRLGGIGDAVVRGGRLAVRIPGLSGHAPAAHHGAAALDAALRFRCRSRGAALLGRRVPGEPPCPGALFARGGRRRVPLPVWPR